MNRIPLSRQLVFIVLGVTMAMCLVAIHGCTIGDKQVGVSYKDMTPKERATYVMSIYNDQYELYMREAKIPDMSEEKKEVLREKKKLLTELYPYIGLYSEYAEQGVFAPADVEMAVMSVMDKLLGL